MKLLKIFNTEKEALNYLAQISMDPEWSDNYISIGKIELDIDMIYYGVFIINK